MQNTLLITGKTIYMVFVIMVVGRGDWVPCIWCMLKRQLTCGRRQSGERYSEECKECMVVSYGWVNIGEPQDKQCWLFGKECLAATKL